MTSQIVEVQVVVANQLPDGTPSITKVVYFDPVEDDAQKTIKALESAGLTRRKEARITPQSVR